MKMCPAHWSALWDEVKLRCLERFCARTKDTATSKVINDEFDPVCAILVEIGRNAFAHVGPECMLPKPDGTLKCPMCELMQACPCDMGERCSVRGWIKLAVADQVQVARDLGLIGQAN
jgi:hypothetical protein